MAPAKPYYTIPMPHTSHSVYAVSDFAEILRGLVEDALPSVWIEGEISNFSRPASGHWYFTLKDSGAQLRCVMFRKANFLVCPQPKDGDQVRVRAQASVYVARGELQLICEAMEPAGQGALLLAFERLKTRLQAEGLFDAAIKRPIPPVPRAIGLITSATGAAIQDVLTALRRRFPLVTVYFHPVPVQGVEAAPAIVAALRSLPARAPVDVVLLVRGGGSLEDLWAFNEEAVARAVRACAVPVICGVGHEVDFSIADFAADLRAPTPTAAAELCTPDVAQWQRTLLLHRDAIQRCWQQGRQRRQEQLRQILQRLLALHPGRRLRDRTQALDELELRLQRALRARLQRWSGRSRDLERRLRGSRLSEQLAALQIERRRLHRRLLRHWTARVDGSRARLGAAESLLSSFNPQAVLNRGYAIARDGAGRVLRDPAQVAADDVVDLQLALGALRLRRARD